MTSYGETFRSIRISKMITLKDIEAQTGITSSFISRFERGKSDVSFTKMQSMLTAINISTEEFLAENRVQVVRPKKDDDVSGIMYEAARLPYLRQYLLFPIINSGHHDQIVAKLHEAERQYRSAPTRSNHFIYLFFQQMALVSKEDWQPRAETLTISRPIVRYLQQVDTWNSYEIYLFELFIISISPEDNIRLLRLGMRKLKRSVKDPLFADMAFALLTADFTSALANNARELARDILIEIDGYDERNASQAIATNFYHGWFAVRFGDNRTGLAQCRDTLTLLQELKVTKAAKILNTIYHGLVKDSQFNMVVLDI
ncbi:Rgg/GadR/MutR family transcriptional regulator [Lacticaseibacillus hulanensis]|uniref:Rgg/GadR/MutR family transcriptional regulator n=1 Tax=Lacticaseibacillus hulanensis TaxID=2493111 RepID=UPI000FDA2038|nr:helix-turn-helix domain-containing protein [Lacticaseibacillus hulanensis]